MPLMETYRPGILSSLLLGETSGEAIDPPAAACRGTAEKCASTSGVQESQHDIDSVTTPVGNTSKQSRKNEVQSTVSSNTSSQAPEIGKSADMVRADESLASLFSTKNLRRFKRKERVDREEDAAEVRVRVLLASFGGIKYCASRLRNSGRSGEYSSVVIDVNSVQRCLIRLLMNKCLSRTKIWSRPLPSPHRQVNALQLLDSSNRVSYFNIGITLMARYMCKTVYHLLK